MIAVNGCMNVKEIYNADVYLCFIMWSSLYNKIKKVKNAINGSHNK